MPPPARRLPRTLALGAWLAARSPVAGAGFVLAALGAIASVAIAFVMARHGGRSLERVPTVASEAIAWSAGVTVAFGGALRALHRDHEQGIVSLVRARGVSIGAYVRGRVVGLIVVLAITIGGATLVAGLAAASVGGLSMAVLRSSGGAIAYALAFSATLGPVALASLGARGRVGGYLMLVTVLVLPELLSPWTSSLFLDGWRELTSIPAALAAVRDGFTAPVTAGASAARALAGLAAVVAVSMLVVGASAARADPERGS
jgi:hypothetical protein